MTPAAITEAETHRLTEGAAKGTALQDLDNATLAKVVKHYDKTHDFYEWRAAYLTACARELRRMGLLDAPRSHIAAAAQRPDGDGKAARWYLEHFGRELV